MIARTLLLAPLALFGLLGCASGGPTGSSQIASSESRITLDRFMLAVSERDLTAMGYLFGTAEGPVANTGNPLGCGFKRVGSWIGLGDRCESWQDIELKLDLIATILEHRGIEVVESRQVAGRLARTQRFDVDILRDRDTIRAVPFEVVQSQGGEWLVESVALERITSR